MKNRKGFVLILLILISFIGQSQSKQRWSIEKAEKWYASQPWISGANFIPSTAINQLEMWQKDTFDAETIDKELGWAESIGFNTMRVYLHSLAYKQDKEGFKNRMKEYLEIADSHNIKTIFVFFDDVWNKAPAVGKQPEPKSGTHNSGWIQDPGDPDYRMTENFPALENYVKDILNSFGSDQRILMWDLYNEPGNSGKLTTSMDLLQNVFKWTREANPDQPITAGIWRWDFEELNQFQIMNSDIITYHDYEEPKLHLRVLQLLKTHNRPLVCTEYMARTRNSRFSNIMPMLKEENVGAINWGLVSGKSNTIYAWDTPIEDGLQPTEWFHDVFRPDGTPYRQDEINLIKKLNNKK
jgi:hypothetical protein